MKMSFESYQEMLDIQYHKSILLIGIENLEKSNRKSPIDQGERTQTDQHKYPRETARSSLRMPNSISQACSVLYIIGIVLTTISSLSAALAIPPSKHRQQRQSNSSLATRGECKDKGICPSNTFWSSIEGTETGMATCYPEGYKAECGPADGLPNLTTFFCCSVNAQDSPCAASERHLPSAPETCPCGSHLVGAQCEGGTLPLANAATDLNSQSAVWPLLASLVFAYLF
jgi:hypothetical protein